MHPTSAPNCTFLSRKPPHNLSNVPLLSDSHNTYRTHFSAFVLLPYCYFPSVPSPVNSLSLPCPLLPPFQPPTLLAFATPSYFCCITQKCYKLSITLNTPILHHSILLLLHNPVLQPVHLSHHSNTPILPLSHPPLLHLTLAYPKSTPNS